MTGSHRTDSTVEGAGEHAESAGRDVVDSKQFGALITVGLVAYGVVHLLVAWIALQIAWTGSGGQASSKGAFAQMASTTVGDVLLWITAVGLFALALWQLSESIWGHRDRDEGRKRVLARLGSAGKTVVYLALCFSAASTAAGSSSGGDSGTTVTARLLSVPFGRIVVIAVGVGVIVAGGRLVYRGWEKKFSRDLAGTVGRGALRLGQIGYLAKGIAFAIVGALIIAASVSYDPQKASGLDAALRTLGQQTYGELLLTVMAAGIACFGLYCFAWSRHAKRT